MKRIFSTLILACTSIYICAAPSDHGRELGEPSSISIFLGRLLLFVFIIVGILILLRSKKNKSNNDTACSVSSNAFQTSTPNSGCISCQGRGFQYGEEIKNIDNFEILCPSCRGYGKKLSTKAIEILGQMATAYSDGEKMDQNYLRNHQDEIVEAQRELRRLNYEYFNKHKVHLTIQQHDDAYLELILKRNEVATKLRQIVENIQQVCTQYGGNDRHCKHCYGKGKELTEEALQLFEMTKHLRKDSLEHGAILKANAEIKRHNTSFGSFLYHRLSSELQEELKDCPTCPSCNGNKKIAPFEIVCKCFPHEIPRYRYYRKINCDLCNGTGK